ncbi:MAG: TRAP transporter large permease subunit, partial [Rickettsiales bacterium]|nr:TRAP transporter large permease subunit [Rickettsiales bacterium]
MAELLLGLLLLVLCIGLLAGYPVALVLGGAGLLTALTGHAFGAFDLSYIAALPNRVFDIMTNDLLVAVPLFVFMGVMLEKARIAEELLEMMGRLFGGVRAGLGISVIVVGALLAASTG